MMYYIILVISTVLLAADFVIQKLYQKRQGTGLAAGMLFNGGIGFFTAIIFLFLNQFKIDFSAYAIIMATLMVIAGVGYVLLGFKVMQAGNMALYTLFVMTGGMVVPYIWGVLFLDEKINAMRVIGLLLIIFAIVLSNFKAEKISGKTILLCVMVFLLNGCGSVISKTCQTPGPYGVVDSMDFVFLTAIVKVILCSVVFFVYKKKKPETTLEIKAVKPTILILVASAVMSGVSYMMQLIGAANLPATVVYPIVSGGCIVFTAVASIVCFKEKLSKEQKIGAILCLVGTCMFL